MNFISNKSCIHRTSAFHIWFTFKHRLIMIICFHSFFWLSSFYSALYSPPFSSFEAYTFFYLIKDFVRLLSSLSFSHLFLVLFYIIHFSIIMLIPNLRIDVRVYQWSEDITYYVDCHVALVATSLLFVKVKKWYSSNVMISICLWHNNALDKYKSDPKHQF